MKSGLEIAILLQKNPGHCQAGKEANYKGFAANKKKEAEASFFLQN
ncbi:MAG: hypothetical protein QM579_02655 [Desulfovibrio sp.]